ncbi:MAG: aldehyde dehydrogenase family protein [Hydrogenophaga sp.]|uniref:aldehyde dehydrogenase family protein n=1 Tax=Hydrogenophaga sp. TaxID=1904254 RepID=UPI002722CBAC|nr:aldehyde dehydrogenase family protein [Hydrogenophaga sp.]MDO9570600.1 aldehyde dehydrogenase family protein [Hydrogenophaga sp.]MDP3376300.1 aldehyde dehydrogenase family protein [Hydrogenophaga sp.]
MTDTPAKPTRPAFLNGSVKRLLIDGQQVLAESGRTFHTINPATGQVLAEVALAEAVDIDKAVAAARRAFEGPWSKFTPFDRQAVLLRLADLLDENFDELAMLDTLDMGAPITATTSRRRRGIALLRYYAGLATSIQGHTIGNSQPGGIFTYTLKEPVGVVAAINPWNGPLGMAIWKIAPALAAGCTVVLKPAEQAPLSPLRLGELCLEAGIPSGVVNVVTGFGEAGAALAAHPGVDKIAFTGSTEVGQHIVRASAGNLKRVSVELGGKSPNIVFADADLDAAVPGAAMAVFLNSGQICSAGTRLFVERKIYEEFVERVAQFARSLKVGDPLDPTTQLGPLVSESQLTRVMGYLNAAQAEGARTAAGGTRLTETGLENGYFVAPTVFSQVSDNMSIAREEIFGPVISALPFDTIGETIQRGNDTPFGLGAGIWTRDTDKVQQITRGLRTGTVWVNCYGPMDPAVPFGGYKMSGYGRESGTEHMDEFLQTKSVWLKGNAHQI